MLSGQHTQLRAIERTDLPQLLAWRNNPAFRQYFREYRELNQAQQTRWFEDIVLQDNRVRMFAICDLDQQLLGACGLCYINWVDRNADFSIYIGHQQLYIDAFYAVDAANTLLQYGFDELNLHRVWAEIYDFDSRKIQLFDQLGFTLEGRHRQTHWTNGQWCDSLFYGRLKSN